MNNATGIITDSGGLQKEAFVLRKPCIALRSITEWIETLELKANRLIEFDVELILKSINDILSGEFEVTSNHPCGNGKASIEIVNAILRFASSKLDEFSK